MNSARTHAVSAAPGFRADATVKVEQRENWKKMCLCEFINQHHRVQQEELNQKTDIFILGGSFESANHKDSRQFDKSWIGADITPHRMI